jgi:hypothetical protein
LALKFAGPWGVLGIDATRDQTEIRRAYARKLKQTNPEDDPEGFQALREAYERAQQLAAWMVEEDELEEETEIDEDLPDEAVEPLQRPENLVAPMPSVVGDRPAGLAPERLDLAPEPAATDRVAPSPVVTGQTPPAGPWGGLEPVNDEERHKARCDALWSAVHDPKADEATVRMALQAVLTSPAMDYIATHDRTEQWLAGLAAGDGPNTGPLIEPLIAHFRWSDDQLGWRPAAADAVFQRRREQALLQAVLRPGHPQYRAYRALTQPPSRLRSLYWRLAPGLPQEVRELLATLRANWPSVLRRLDPASVAWWEAFLGKPQFRLAIAVTTFLVALLGSGIAALSGDNPGFRSDQPWAASAALAAVMLGPFATAFGWLYGVERPRWRWKSSDHYERPLWQRFGWAPAVAVLAIVAAAAPAIPAVMAALIVAGVGVAYWALITGEPDRQPGRGSDWQLTHYSIFGLAVWASQFLWRPGQRYHWLARSIFAFFYLGAFWIGVRPYLPAAEHIQLSIPLALGSLTFVLGAESLQEFWAWELSDRVRAIGAVALGSAALLALALLAGASRYPVLLLPGLTLAGLAVLAHKTPAASLAPEPYLARDLVMRFGWLSIPLISAFTMVGSRAPVWPGGLWLLSGTLVTVGAALFAQWREAHPKPRRQRDQPLNL